MTIGEFIKDRRQRAGLSAKEVAKRAGVSDVYILYIERGLRNPTFSNLAKIMEALGVPFEEFLISTGYMVERGHYQAGNHAHLQAHLQIGEPSPDMNVEPLSAKGLAKIPVISWVTAGKWKEVCDAFEPGDADEWIESDIKGVHVFALRVTGDSMEPEFKDGEIIIVNPHLEATPGDFVVVKNKQGQATFKQLKKYGNRWVLHPLNSRYPDLEVKKGDFSIIGRVVKKERRY